MRFLQKMLVALAVSIGTAVFLVGTAPACGLPIVRCDEPWTDDINAAQTAAVKEQKDILLNFTGSDWCQFCIALDKAVMGKSEFASEAAKNFVLVTLDFPRDETKVSPEVAEQNLEWQKRLAIEGFPTIALLDSQLRPYAFTGFREEGPEQYLAHLETLRATRIARDEALAKAAKVKGTARAKFLDEALEALDHQVVETYYTDLINEIVELDPKDEAGLRTKYYAAQERELQRALLSDIAMVARLKSPEVAVKFIDEAIAAIRMAPATQYQVLLTKLDLFRKMGQSQRAEGIVDEMMKIEGLDAVDLQKLIVKKAFLMFGDNRRAEALEWLDGKIKELSPHQYLLLAKCELLVSAKQLGPAIQLFDAALAAAGDDPELTAAVIAAKADALVEQGNADDAIQAIDRFVDQATWPQVVRAEALLHKALILRGLDRRRAAILAENKALEIAESPLDKAHVQRLVDQLRRKFETSTQ
jgi:thioredoxin-related protein